MAVPAANAPLIIVLNAGSGQRDEAATRAEIEAPWLEARRPFEIVAAGRGRSIDDAAAEAVVLARRAGGVVVAAGGDGTINTVAQALRGSGLAFGVIPLGTFNYFARVHGIPEEAGAAARALLDARMIQAQAGQVNGRIFLVNASVGLYPQLLVDREAFKKLHGRSRAGALWSGLCTLVREHRQWRLRIESEEGTRDLRTPTLFVGNNAMQLERLGIAEAVAVAQARGIMAAIVVRETSGLGMLGLALRGALGVLGEAHQIDSFAFLRLTADPVGHRRIRVALDGEVMMMRPPLLFEPAPTVPLLVPVTPPEAA
jgi:diacylglycerol kinase family enzyme